MFQRAVAAIFGNRKSLRLSGHAIKQGLPGLWQARDYYAFLDQFVRWPLFN